MPNPAVSLESNQVLARLSAVDAEALRPHFLAMEVSKGQVLIEQGDPVAQLHFPTTADLSNTMIFSDGLSAENSTVGRDGVSGLAAFLAGEPCWWQVVVQTPGALLAIDAAPLRRQLERGPGLMRLMLKLSYDYQCQSAQSASCNALHDALWADWHW